MAKELQKVLDSYGIMPDKVHLVLRDGATAMVKMTKILDYESFHCFLHIINLVNLLYNFSIKIMFSVSKME